MAEGRHHFNTMKKDLRSVSLSDLNKILREKQLELIKAKREIRDGNNRRMYKSEDAPLSFKAFRKEIAIIRTIIKEKMEDENGRK